MDVDVDCGGWVDSEHQRRLTLAQQQSFKLRAAMAEQHQLSLMMLDKSLTPSARQLSKIQYDTLDQTIRQLSSQLAVGPAYAPPLMTKYTISLDSAPAGGGTRYLLALMLTAMLCYGVALPMQSVVVPLLMIFLPLALQHCGRSHRSMWDQVVIDHAKQIAQVERETERFMGHRRFTLLTTAMGVLVRALPMRWCDEVCAMSRQTGVSIGCLGFLQIIYEFAAACTSIVLSDPAEKSPLVHIRTMDWRMPFDLSPLTVEIDFTRNGKLIYTATTFAGYTGVLTGMRHRTETADSFSIAVNFRGRAAARGDEDIGAVSAVLRGAMLVGQQVRHVLEDGPIQYEDVVETLGTAWLLAPCYLTVVPGKRSAKAIVLTRGRSESVNPRWGTELVQANMDDSKIGDSRHPNVMNSVARVEYCHSLINLVKKQRILQGLASDDQIAWTSLWELISVAPLTHNNTVYANVMCAGNSTFETRVNRNYAGKFEITLNDLRTPSK